MTTAKRAALIESSIQAVANFGFHGAPVSLLIEVIRANAAGFLYLDNGRISRTVEACWDAVSV